MLVLILSTIVLIAFVWIRHKLDPIMFLVVILLVLRRGLLHGHDELSVAGSRWLDLIVEALRESYYEAKRLSSRS